MLDDIYRFLEANPSETILMSLKREGAGRGTDQHLSRYLQSSHVDKRPERWRALGNHWSRSWLRLSWNGGFRICGLEVSREMVL